jgi:hypothetical protein
MDFFGAQDNIKQICFETTAWVKFKISNSFKENIDETDSKQPNNPYQPMDFKNLKTKIREPKASRLLPNLCDFQ